MEAKELRIGNYVQTIPFDYLIYEIASIEHSVRFRMEGDYYLWVNSISKQEKTGTPINQKGNWSIETFAPIQLTGEWLLKFGFKKLAENKEYKQISYSINNGKFILTTLNNSFYVIYSNSEYKYVHQLQNLYFTLIGEELKIN
jgi:hypothetical protein